MYLLTINKEDTHNSIEATINLEQITLISKQKLNVPAKNGAKELFLICLSSGDTVSVISPDVISKIHSIDLDLRIKKLSMRSKKNE